MTQSSWIESGCHSEVRAEADLGVSNELNPGRSERVLPGVVAGVVIMDFAVGKVKTSGSGGGGLTYSGRGIVLGAIVVDGTPCR
jgi:hypothetical protein